MARIGIDVTAALMQGGGIGRYTRELVRAVTREGERHQYRLFSARPPAAPPVPDPLPQAPHVSYHPVPLNERWLYRLWHRLRLPLPIQLATGRLDLFHSPDFVLPPVWGQIPTLLTVHDLSFIHYPETFPPPLIRYLNTVVPRSTRRADHILADSEATKRDLAAAWDVAPAKITVLYGGVDPVFRHVEDEAGQTAVRRRYDLADFPYVLAVGTIQPRKNYRMLIRAFAPLAADFPHHLAIAGGKGWLYEEMLAEAAQLDIADRVHFLGFVDDADLPALYSGATLFAFPSLYEGFGLPLLEAMGCGTPVVSSNASSLPEVVGEGETAVLLPPKDQAAWTETMRHLLSDPAARRRLAAAGKRRVRHFTWDRAARQLLDVYQALLT